MMEDGVVDVPDSEREARDGELWGSPANTHVPHLTCNYALQRRDGSDDTNSGTTHHSTENGLG